MVANSVGGMPFQIAVDHDPIIKQLPEKLQQYIMYDSAGDLHTRAVKDLLDAKMRRTKNVNNAVENLIDELKAMDAKTLVSLNYY